MSDIYSEDVNIALDQVQTREAKSSRDFSVYDGMKIPIEEIKIKKEINFYPDGMNFDADSKETIYRVYIFSAPLPELDSNGNPTGKFLEAERNGVIEKIRVHSRFNLNQDESGQPYMSKHAKAKCWAFCRKHGANNLQELKNKFVRLTLVPSKTEGDDRKFLRIVE